MAHPNITVILGLGIVARYLASALAVDERTALLQSCRLGRAQGDARLRARIVSHVRKLLCTHRPQIVALDSRAVESGEHVVKIAVDVLRELCSSERLPLYQISREQISAALGLADPSNRGVHHHLLLHDPLLARLLGYDPSKIDKTRPRTNKDRYHEPSLVALAVALTAAIRYAPLPTTH